MCANTTNMAKPKLPDAIRVRWDKVRTVDASRLDSRHSIVPRGDERSASLAPVLAGQVGHTRKNEGRCFWRPGENECVEKTDLGTCEGQAAMWNVTNSASRCVNDEDCPLPQSDDDLTHCHHSPPGGACRVYEVDCPVGTFESHGHYCYPGCSDGCPIGLLCFDHLCFPQECFSRSDCPAPYACRDGQCERPSCADGKCCPPPFRCARGEEICVEPPAR